MAKNKIVHAVKTDGIDEIAFSIVRDSKRISSLCNTDQTEGLTQDAFTGLFSQTAKIDEGAPVVQRGIIDTMMKLPEFHDIRTSTQGDEVGSGLGAIKFAPGLIEQFQQVEKKFKDAQDKARGEGKPAPESLVDALSESDMASLRGALRRGLEEAQEDADQWADVKESWGVDTAELQQLPFEERMVLAEKLMKSNRLKKISDMIGRFKNIVNTASATVPVHGYDEIVNIGLGSDISRILPTEYVKLAETPDLFFSDMIEGKLLTYDIQGVENLGKGPIIACLDISGSMNDYGREQWAKAVVLSLQALAEKQGRAFGVIAFESKVRFSRFWSKNKKATLQDKVEVASIASEGGTDFYPALMKAFEQRLMDPEFKPADIVFITDGECQLKTEQLEQVLKLKKDTNTRIYSMAIATGYGGSKGTSLEPFSDQISIVNSEGDVESVRGVVSKAVSTQRSKKA